MFMLSYKLVIQISLDDFMKYYNVMSVGSLLKVFGK